jgi:hypothetical protein
MMSDGIGVLQPAPPIGLFGGRAATADHGKSVGAVSPIWPSVPGASLRRAQADASWTGGKIAAWLDLNRA